MSLELEPVGIIHSCFKEKFGTPRQAFLASEATARLEILPPYNRPEAFEGLEEFSHLWLVFHFHQNKHQRWQPMVRPPRLGGKKKQGVFATRSPYRPNPIGISAVELISIDFSTKGIFLNLKGVDLIHGTPVFDIKPYIVYADSFPDAESGFASSIPDETLSVCFSGSAEQTLQQLHPDDYESVKSLITQILCQDPRPPYLDGREERKNFGMHLIDFDLKWEIQGKSAVVTRIIPLD